jgi:hypothetical protein
MCKLVNLCTSMTTISYLLLFYLFFTPVTKAIATRSNRTYMSTHARTNTRKFTMQYQGPLTWNNLPRDIQGVTNLSHFKRLTRTYILNIAT